MLRMTYSSLRNWTCRAVCEPKSDLGEINTNVAAGHGMLEELLVTSTVYDGLAQLRTHLNILRKSIHKQTHDIH